MFAELFTPEQLTILTQIILIDLVLAGDNAIIIGMVASKFPLEQRKKIIFWGIGGAVMNVPILKYFGYPIKKAIGSAATIGFIIALCGAIGFWYSGIVLNTKLPLSLGFINIPAFLIFIPITMLMARVGANSAHKIDKTKLQVFFGIFLYIVGTIFVFRYSGL